MNKQLYVLRGRASSGKSSIIGHVYKSLKLNRQVKQLVYKTVRNDFLGILVIKGRKIGFASEGDKGIWLEEHINYLEKQGCEIIITASRTSGETVHFLETLLPNHNIEWLEQKFYYSSSPHICNDEVVENIITWVYGRFKEYYEAKDNLVKNLFDNLRNLFIGTTLFIAGLILLNTREYLLFPLLCEIVAWIVIVSATALTGWNAVHGINKVTRHVRSRFAFILWGLLGALYFFATLAVFESYVLVIGQRTFPEKIHFLQFPPPTHE